MSTISTNNNGNISNNILFSLSNSLRTGNIIFDIIIVSLCGNLLLYYPNILSYINNLYLKIKNYFNINVDYKYTYNIECQSIVSNRSVINSNDNFTIINGILLKLSNCDISQKNIINVFNNYNNNVSSRILYYNLNLLCIPLEDIKYKDLLIKINSNINNNINNDNKNTDFSISKTFNIKILSNNNDSIIEFINICSKEYVNIIYKSTLYDLNILYYINNNERDDYFKIYKWDSNRTFDSIFFKNKNKFINNIDNFINKKQYWDPKKERPHTCKIFLHGPPGTGKTSIIKAIAKYTNRNVFIIRLSCIDNIDVLYNVIFNSTVKILVSGVGYAFETVEFNKRIYVFEDLDCDGCDDIIKPRNKNDDDFIDLNEDISFNKNESNEEFKDKPKYIGLPKNKTINFKNNKITLSSLLNLLDGINEMTDSMLIISTNNIDKFDPAIYRQGRMDIKLELSYMDKHTIKEYLQWYFNEDCPDFELRNHRLTPSQLESMCQTANNIDDIIMNL